MGNNLAEEQKSGGKSVDITGREGVYKLSVWKELLMFGKTKKTAKLLF